MNVFHVDDPFLLPDLFHIDGHSHDHKIFFSKRLTNGKLAR